MYLLAIICPPLAVLLVGKPGQALLNLLLCCCLVFPGVIHAICVVAESKAEARNDRVLAAIRAPQSLAAPLQSRYRLGSVRPSTER
jgi:uncharacterized membrane protein YqaE (UPF0057 family)